MKKGKYFLWAGLALLAIGTLAASMSQLIVEDILGMERPFGEEPLSIKLIRAGLLLFALGAAAMIYGGWLNRKGQGR